MKPLHRCAGWALALAVIVAVPAASPAVAAQADEAAAPGSEAEHLARVAAFEREAAPGDPAYLDALTGLSLFYVNQGRHADAVPVLRRALAASERMLGAGDELTEEIRATLVLLERFVDRH